MAGNHDKYTKETMGKNIKKLLVSALSPVAASDIFKWKLLLRLKSAVSRLTTNVLRQSAMDADFEYNLGRLMTSASMQSSAVPGFRERLLYQLTAENEKAQRKPHSLYLVPALAGLITLILVIGAVIYPDFWAARDIGVSAAVNQGTCVITQTKPLFFIWGSRVVQSSLSSGASVSLVAGDRIATNPDALVVLALFNGSSVKLYPSSELLINKLKAGDANNQYTVGLKLETGRATSKVNQLNFILETPVAETSVLGTNFRIEVISTNHTYLATDEGIVQLTMEENTVRVSEGEEVQAIKGQPLLVTGQRPPIVLFDLDNFTADKKLSSPLTMHAMVYPEAKGTVNGQPFVANQYGWFAITLKLEQGKQDINITVTSPTGKTTNYEYPVMIKNP